MSTAYRSLHLLPLVLLLTLTPVAARDAKADEHPDKLSAETFAECRSQLGDDQELLELTASISWWRAISTLLRSIEIPLEEGIAAWPPDGATPAGA